MIPNKIHYCWFGKKKIPSNVVRYIDSWKEHLPNFDIKQWNEENFDVNMFDYTKEAYFAKKYAFVSDVARLWALVEEGGLYLDTDILVLKPFNPKLWENEAFVGFEHFKYIGTGVMAAERRHPFFIEFLQRYENMHFFKNINFDEETNVSRITKLFLEKGCIPNNTRQIIANVKVYEQELFCNKNWKTNQYYNSEKSYTIHDFQSSWISDYKFFFSGFVNRFSNITTILSYKLFHRYLRNYSKHICNEDH